MAAIDGVEFAVRSRESFDRKVRLRLIEAGVDEDTAMTVTTELMTLVGMKPDEKKSKKAKESEDGKNGVAATGQVTVLGPKELDYLFQEAKALAPDVAAEKPKDRVKAAKEALKAKAKDREWKKNLQALGAGLDVAMFGRMVTGDVFSAVDAAVHVAHAFTVHGELSESDYFSAVDDLMKEEGETGSGHINTQELTSGLFYGYVVVDVPLLVANLTGVERGSWREAERALAAEVVERLVNTIATVSPGAKLGSTAPYSRAHFVCVERGTQQPCSIANAFVKAVPTHSDVIAEAYEAMRGYVSDVDANYGFDGERRFMAVGASGDLAALGGKLTLPQLVEFAGQSVRA